MTRSAVLCAGGALLLFAPASASAQRTVPKQVVVQDYADCMVRQAPERAKALLDTELGSKEEAEQARKVALATYPCLKGRPGLSMQTGSIRGSAAAAMFSRQPHLIDRLSTLPAVPAQRPAAADGRAFVIAYAGCLEQASPAASAALLRTGIASAEERTKSLAYGDALKDCMPIDQQYSVNITDVRNHIAAAAYRRLAGRAGA